MKEQDQAKIYKGYGIGPADSEGNNRKSFNFAAVGDFGCSKIPRQQLIISKTVSLN